MVTRWIIMLILLLVVQKKIWYEHDSDWGLYTFLSFIAGGFAWSILRQALREIFFKEDI